MIKKVLFFIGAVLLAASIHAHAQNIKKLERNYQKAKYEKVISKAEKYIVRGKENADVYMYLTQGLIAYGDQQLGSSKERTYYKASKAYTKLLKMPHNDVQIQMLYEEVHHIVHSVLTSTHDLSTERKKYYASFLAEHYADTVETYYSLFKISQPIYLEKVNTTSYLNSQKIIKKKNGLTYTIPSIIPPKNLLVSKSEEVIGTPYKYAGETPGKGMDCSGFILWTYRQFGYEFPHQSGIMAKISRPVPQNQVKVGDWVCFGAHQYNPNKVYHIGLIHSIEGGVINMIHCGTSKGVGIAPVNRGYWSKKAHFFVRLSE